MLLNQFVKQQRNKRGLTQEHLAFELGISRPAYEKIERGTRDLTVSEAMKLAAVFEMPLGHFPDAEEPRRSITIEKDSTKKSSDLQIRVTGKILKNSSKPCSVY